MITVIDAPCGAGKTTWCINYINEHPTKKFIYITPFLSEVDRILNSTTDFVTPLRDDKTKHDNFIELISRGDNIVSTHALFKTYNDEIASLIKDGEYVLILDEVMSVVEHIPLKKDDIPNMLNAGLIQIDETDDRVIWIATENESRYDDFKERCLTRTIYAVDNSAICWVFPPDIFEAFEDVFICTYMFDCQMQRYYYDYFNIKYTKMSMDSHELVPFSEDLLKTPTANKIHIYEDEKLNSIGEKDLSLSKGWYRKAGNKKAQIKNALYNYFENKVNTTHKNAIWTTFSEYEEAIRCKGHKNSFLFCNARAVNEYADKHYIAYTINLFINPYIDRFFQKRSIVVDQDTYAMSELVQFIYRSAVRNNEHIYVLILSQRMRNLLKKFVELYSTK